MSNWPLASGESFPLGFASAPYAGVEHVKGAWSEIVASTPFHGAGLFLSVADYNSASTRYLIDIGIGPVGAETVLVSNIGIAMVQYRPVSFGVLLPLAVPKGSRLSVRQQISRSTATGLGNWRLGLVAPSPLLPTGFQRCLTVGADTAQTELTPVLQNYASDLFYEFLASAPFRVRAFSLLAMGTNDSNSSATVKVGVGPSGSEQVIGPAVDVVGFGGATRAGGPVITSAIPCDIPTGSRISIAVRGSSAAYTHSVGLLLFG